MILFDDMFRKNKCSLSPTTCRYGFVQGVIAPISVLETKNGPLFHESPGAKDDDFVASGWPVAWIQASMGFLNGKVKHCPPANMAMSMSMAMGNLGLEMINAGVVRWKNHI